MWLFGLLVVASINGGSAGSADWDVADVEAWVGEQGWAFGDQFIETVRTHEVTGPVLMHIEKADLEDEFGIASGLDRAKVMAALEKLVEDEKVASGEDWVSPTMGFWEFRSMNRKQIDWLTALLTGAPRFAISHMGKLPPQARPANEIGGWLEWLLLPQYYIFVNTETILGGLPGLIPFACLVGLLTTAFGLIKCMWDAGFAPRALFASVVAFVATTIGAEILLATFVWLFMNILWPVIPWFITDLFCYFGVYVMPVFSTLFPLFTAFNLFKKSRTD